MQACVSCHGHTDSPWETGFMETSYRHYDHGTQENTPIIGVFLVSNIHPSNLLGPHCLYRDTGLIIINAN